MFIRICPSCDKEVIHKTKDSLNHCKGKLCWSCAQSSPEKANKVSIANKGKSYNKSNLGKKQSPEWIEKRSRSLRGRVPGFGGKKHKSKTRLQMSKRRSEMLRERFGDGQLSPWYNKDACVLFDEINTTLNWNGLHAENGGEFYIDGFWLDYYEPYHNVVIEYDEERHEIPSVMKKDVIRQNHITSKLKCRFFRIKRGDELKWKNILEVS